MENTIAQKVAAVSGELLAIPKVKHKESTVQYAFRSIDDVMNALNPLLAKHGICIAFKVLERKLTPIEGANNKRQFMAEVIGELCVTDGIGSITAVEWAMSIDYSDKAPTQACSMAYKYALIRMFVVTTENIRLDDADFRNVEVSNTAKITPPAQPNEAEQKKAFLAALETGLAKEMYSEFNAKNNEFKNRCFALYSAYEKKEEALARITTELINLRKV